MAATAAYGFPYPSTSDSPHGPNQIQAGVQAIENKIVTMDADRVLIKALLAGYAPPTQTGSGSLTVGGNGAEIMQVAIPDPGFPYHIIASGSLAWGMAAATQPGQLLQGSITINSTAYNTNRLCGGSSISHSLGAGFSQSTLQIPAKRSDAFGAQTGAKTIRLIARNSSITSATMAIPAASEEITLTVRIVPA